MFTIRPALMLVLGALALFSGAAWAVPYRDLSEGTIVVGTALCSLASVAFFAPALNCLLYPAWPPREKWAALAVWMALTGVALHGLVSILWRLSGQPAFLVNNPAYTSWIGIWIIPAALILVSAPNLFGPGVPPRERASLGLAWIIAVTFIAYLAFIRPDLTPVAEWLRPYLDIGYGYGKCRLGSHGPPPS